MLLSTAHYIKTGHGAHVYFKGFSHIDTESFACYYEIQTTSVLVWNLFVHNYIGHKRMPGQLGLGF